MPNVLRSRHGRWALTITAMFAVGPGAGAQERRAAAADAAASKGPFRVLAPGVEVTIPPDTKVEETFSNHDVVEIQVGVPNLKWTPKLSAESQTLKALSTDTVFRRQAWCLQFSFKPVRMLWVDVPQKSGKMQRKLIWYLAYRVTNLGGHLLPKRDASGNYSIEQVNEPVTFEPHFVLESPEFKKAYLDRVVPVAMAPIRQKEDPNRRYLNSIEMGARPIEVSTDKVDRSVWGVATWENLDPRIDEFSVYVQGLTNAYRWADPPGGFKAGDPPGTGRVLQHKTLVLRFWRPGDEFQEDQRIIRYGSRGKELDHRWVYR